MAGGGGDAHRLMRVSCEAVLGDVREFGVKG